MAQRSASESGDERRADPPRSFWRRLRRGGSRRAQRGPRRADLRRAARARQRPAAGAGVQGAPCSWPTLRPHTAAGGVALHRTGATLERREEADGVTAARRWRDVCRLVIGATARWRCTDGMRGAAGRRAGAFSAAAWLIFQRSGIRRSRTSSCREL